MTYLPNERDDYNPYQPNRYYVRAWYRRSGVFGTIDRIWGAFWGMSAEPDYTSPVRSVAVAWAQQHPARTLQLAESQYRHLPPLLRFIRAVVDASERSTDFDQSPFFHLRVDSLGCLPLIIQAQNSIQPLFDRETRRVSIAQYTTLRGQPVPDTLFHLTNAGDPIEYFIYLAYNPVLWRGSDGSVEIRPQVRRDADKLAASWAVELERQGFIEAARNRFAPYALVDEPGA